MSRRADLPAELCDSPFSTQTARRLGVTPARLRAKDVQHPFHAVNSMNITEAPPAAGSVPALQRRAAEYRVRMADDEFFSHATAARLHGIPLPAHVQACPLLDVSVICPSYPPQARGVRGHRLRRADLTLLNGLAASTPVSAWCELASILSIEALVVAGDYLLAGPDPHSGIQPFATTADLARAARDSYRRPGAKRLRSAAALVRPGVRSPKETELRLCLISAGLPEPVPNFVVACTDGTTRMLDLAYPQLRLAFEYEGDMHRTDRALFLSDIERREALADCGWEIIRVVATHLHRSGRKSFTSRVRRRIASRAKTL